MHSLCPRHQITLLYLQLKKFQTINFAVLQHIDRKYLHPKSKNHLKSKIFHPYKIQAIEIQCLKNYDIRLFLEIFL